MDIKIAKYLSECGIASRRKAELLVQQGQICVNGKVMKNEASRINPDSDKVTFQGKPVSPQTLVYYLLNKPVGYTSTTSDPHAKRIITELIPKKPPVWPVGRLDVDTSGLILLTNDGNLTQRLTHPKFQKEKEYLIVTNEPLDRKEVRQIQDGVELEDGFIKPDSFKEVSPKHYSITIHSGKKRIVRRIVEKTGKRVAELKRVRFAFLVLEKLQPGKWRPLAEWEIKRLSATTRASKLGR